MARQGCHTRPKPATTRYTIQPVSIFAPMSPSDAATLGLCEHWQWAVPRYLIATEKFRTFAATKCGFVFCASPQKILQERYRASTACAVKMAESFY